VSVVARRLGMDSKDPELNQRLRRIEQVLSMKAAANEFVDNPSAANQDIPKPENLTSEYHITKWKVTWDPVDIPDVKKYEMIVGTDAAFSTVIGNYTRTEPEFTYPGASANLTYFIRVRAVNLDFEDGPWSDTLDVTTGQVTTADIEANALTQLWEFNQESGFTALYDGDQGYEGVAIGSEVLTDTYGPLTITVSGDTAIILPFATFDVYYQSIYQDGGVGTWGAFDPLNMLPNYVRIRFDRAPAGTGTKTNLMDMYLDYWSTIPYSTTWRKSDTYAWSTTPLKQPVRGSDVCQTRIALPLLPDAPGAGSFDYTFTINVGSNPDCFMYVLPYALHLNFLEYKNT